MQRARPLLRRFGSAALALAALGGFAGIARSAADQSPASPVGGGISGSLAELLEAEVTGGYVMTHEHPWAGMSFGGNYAYAGVTLSNYQNGIPEAAYGTCNGCPALSKCDHAEVKGNFIGPKLGRDMGDHAAQKGPFYDSNSHLRYTSNWIKEAWDPAGTTYDDARMKILVAFALENEIMCEALYYENAGGGGAGGNGYPCSTGDSWASLSRQIASIKAWAAAHASWAEIAYSAADARRIANANKLVVVIGVEAEYAFGAEDRTFDVVGRLEAYHALGVRTFYLAHKINSRLAGADAYYPKDTDDGKLIRAGQAISGCFYYDDHVATFPLVDGGHEYCDNDAACGIDSFLGKWPSTAPGDCNDKASEISEWNIGQYQAKGDTTFNGFAIYPVPPGFSGPGGTWMDGSIERNELGLSTDGERVVRRAMQLGMIMNLDHISKEAREDVRAIALAEFANYPLNALHNNPNEEQVGSSVKDEETPFPHEYDFGKAERDAIRTSGGIFGVRLGPVDSNGHSPSGVTLNCPRTSTETAKILAYLVDEGLNVGYSLDFASVAKGIPSRTEEGCGTSLGTDWLQAYGTVTTEGLSHIGMMKYWHKELEEIGLAATYLDRLKSDGAEAFIDMWESSEDRALP